VRRARAVVEEALSWMNVALLKLARSKELRRDELIETMFDLMWFFFSRS
jgi:hypothetical protein